MAKTSPWTSKFAVRIAKNAMTHKNTLLEYVLNVEIQFLHWNANSAMLGTAKHCRNCTSMQKHTMTRKKYTDKAKRMFWVEGTGQETATRKIPEKGKANGEDVTFGNKEEGGYQSSKAATIDRCLKASRANDKMQRIHKVCCRRTGLQDGYMKQQSNWKPANTASGLTSKASSRHREEVQYGKRCDCTGIQKRESGTEMEAHVTHVLNGIACSMAPAGLVVRGCEVRLRGTSATATSSEAALRGPAVHGFRAGQGSTAFG